MKYNKKPPRSSTWPSQIKTSLLPTPLNLLHRVLLSPPVKLLRVFPCRQLLWSTLPTVHLLCSFCSLACSLLMVPIHYGQLFAIWKAFSLLQTYARFAAQPTIPFYPGIRQTNRPPLLPLPAAMLQRKQKTNTSHAPTTTTTTTGEE